MRQCKVKVLSGEVGLPDDTEKRFEQGRVGGRNPVGLQVKVQNDMTVQVLSATGHMGRKKDMARLPEGFIPDRMKEVKAN